MNNNIAVLLLTQNDYLAEAKLIIDKLNELKFQQYFKCYIACKEVKLIPRNINWNKLDIKLDCKNWGSEILCALDLIKEEYIFIYLDDFYPFKQISTFQLKKNLEKCLKYKPSLVRINSNYNRRILLKKKEKNIYEESYLHRFSTSLVLPIFQKKFLRKIVDKYDSPWIFEKKSNKRFDFRSHRFLFIKGNNIDFKVANIIVRGESLRTSINRVPSSKKYQYMSTTKNTKKPFIKELLFHLKKLFSDLFMRYLPYY